MLTEMAMAIALASATSSAEGAPPPMPSGARTGCPSSMIEKRNDGTASVVCAGQVVKKAQPATAYTTPKPVRAIRRTGAPVPTTVRAPVLTLDPAGELCWKPGSGRVPADDLQGDGPLAAANKLFKTYPRCPSNAAPEPPDPETVVIDVIEQFPLPAPKPYIGPGRAITGLRAFLEPNMDQRYTGTRSTPLGDIQLDATAVYFVDWGDESTGPHRGPGGPWPSGNITHMWINTGTVDVVVTAQWTVDWRMGADSGTLTVPTEGTIEDFPIGQLQAVINR